MSGNGGSVIGPQIQGLKLIVQTGANEWTYKMVISEFWIYMYHWNLRTIYRAENLIIRYLLLLAI